MKKFYCVLLLSIALIAPECCAMKRVGQSVAKKYLKLKEFSNKHVGNKYVGIPTIIGGTALACLVTCESGKMLKVIGLYDAPAHRSLGLLLCSPMLTLAGWSTLMGALFLFIEVNKGLALVYTGSQIAAFYKGLKVDLKGVKKPKNNKNQSI